MMLGGHQPSLRRRLARGRGNGDEGIPADNNRRPNLGIHQEQRRHFPTVAGTGPAAAGATAATMPNNLQDFQQQRQQQEQLERQQQLRRPFVLKLSHLYCVISGVLAVLAVITSPSPPEPEEIDPDMDIDSELYTNHSDPFSLPGIPQRGEHARALAMLFERKSEWDSTEAIAKAAALAIADMKKQEKALSEEEDDGSSDEDNAFLGGHDNTSEFEKNLTVNGVEKEGANEKMKGHGDENEILDTCKADGTCNEDESGSSSDGSTFAPTLQLPSFPSMSSSELFIKGYHLFVSRNLGMKGAESSGMVAAATNSRFWYWLVTPDAGKVFEMQLNAISAALGSGGGEPATTANKELEEESGVNDLDDSSVMEESNNNNIRGEEILDPDEKADDSLVDVSSVAVSSDNTSSLNESALALNETEPQTFIDPAILSPSPSTPTDIIDKILTSTPRLLAIANLLLAITYLLHTTVAEWFLGVSFHTNQDLAMAAGRERLGGFLVFKLLLISAVVAPDTLDLLILLSWYTILSFLRSLAHLAAATTSHTTQSGQTPPPGVLRLLILVLLCDFLAAAFCVALFHQAGWGMVLLLTSDCALLAVDVFCHMLRHMGQVFDEVHGNTISEMEEQQIELHNRERQSRESGGNADTSDDNDNMNDQDSFFSNEDAIFERSRQLDQQMEEMESDHSRRLDVLDTTVFALQLVAHVVTVCHFLHIWTLHGIQFTLIDGVLALHLHSALSSASKKIAERRNLDLIARRLNHTFVDATEMDIRKVAAAGDVCCICLGTMSVGSVKKVGCGHLFHTHCLREVVERARSMEAARCPLCRAYVIDGTHRSAAPAGNVVGNNNINNINNATAGGDPLDNSNDRVGNVTGVAAQQRRATNLDAPVINNNAGERALFRFTTEGILPAWLPVPAFSFEVVRRPPVGGDRNNNANTNITATVATNQVIVDNGNNNVGGNVRATTNEGAGVVGGGVVSVGTGTGNDTGLGGTAATGAISGSNSLSNTNVNVGNADDDFVVVDSTRAVGANNGAVTGGLSAATGTGVNTNAGISASNMGTLAAEPSAVAGAGQLDQQPQQQQIHEQQNLLQRFLVLTGALPMSPEEENLYMDQLVDMFPQYDRLDLLRELRRRRSIDAVAESVLSGALAGRERGNGNSNGRDSGIGNRSGNTRQI